MAKVEREAFLSELWMPSHKLHVSAGAILRVLNYMCFVNSKVRPCTCTSRMRAFVCTSTPSRRWVKNIGRVDVGRLGGLLPAPT